MIGSSNGSRLFILVLCLTLFGYELVAFVTHLLSVNTTVASIGMRLLRACLALYIFWTIGVKKSFFRSWAFMAVCLFAVIYSVRVYVDVLIFEIDTGLPAVDYLKTVGAFATMLGAFHVASLRTYINAYRSVLAVALITLMLFVASITSGFRVSVVDFVGAPNINNISLGHMGASISLLSGYGLVVKGLLDKKSHLLLALLAFSAGVVVLLMAGKRGPLIAYSLPTLLLLALACYKSLIYADTYYVLLIGSMSAVFIVMPIVFSELLNEMIYDLKLAYRLDTYSATNRINLFRDALSGFYASPIVGNSITPSHPDAYVHNIILSAFLSTGTFGGTLLLSLIILSSVKSMKLILTSHVAGWTGLLLLQYIIAHQFSGAIWSANEFWFLLLLVLLVPSRYVLD